MKMKFSAGADSQFKFASWWRMLVTGILTVSILGLAVAVEGKKGGGGKPGGGGDAVTLGVSFAADDSFVAVDPTLTTSAPTPTTKKLNTGAIVLNQEIRPTGGSVWMTNATIYLTKKRGKVTHVYINVGDGSPTEAEHYGSTGYLVVDPSVAVSDAGFTLHVHADGVPLIDRAGNNFGMISVGDVVYTPIP
jgi:hypothetical protein